MIIIQLLIFLLQLFVFLFSENGEVSFIIINSSAILTLVSFIVSVLIRKKTILRDYNFSIISFFIIMTWIISFQVPLEIAYGNTRLLDYKFIYNRSIINEITSFSALMLDAFLLGVSFNYIRNKNIKYKVQNSKYLTKPLFVLLFISFLIFLIFLDKSYIDGGHGSVSFEGIGPSFFGIFIRLSIIYLSIVIFNNQNNQNNNTSITSFLLLFNKLYLLILLLVIIIFLLAHNRVYIILVIAPFIFSFFVFTKMKIGLLKIVGIFLSLSVFSTLFKLYGIDSIFDNGLNIDKNYVITKSYFPFTVELGGSVYSQTIIYYEYINNNYFIYGYSYLIGLFRAFPGLMGIINLDKMQYDTAIYATRISGVNYGVGTTSISDFLVNFGPFLSLLFFYIIGYYFSLIETNVYKKGISIYTYVIFFTITGNVFFIPRASMNDLLGALIFNLFFIKIYTTIYQKKNI